MVVQIVDQFYVLFDESPTYAGATFSDVGISRVRITSGSNTIVANGVQGNPNDDVVVMDDFIYAEPMTVTDFPEPGTLALLALGLAVDTPLRSIQGTV